MSKKETRIDAIERILNEKGLIYIRELAQQLDVSEMTIRRDIRQMEKEEKVKNLNGLLVSSSADFYQSVTRKYELHNQSTACNREKAAIGQYAASRIDAGDCIFFDVGTTVEQIAKYAPKDIKFEAFCVTLNTFLCFVERPKVTVALAGGHFDHSTEMFISDQGVNFIRSVRANKVFLSAAAIHEDLGVSCINRYEVNAKKAMLQSARHRILVADSSKFGSICSAFICELSEIDEIITDDHLSDKWRRLIESKGICLNLIPCK